MEQARMQLSLSYHGEAVDSGRLDVYEAAANMMAFSDFVTAAGKSMYGPTVHLKAEVSGFRAGSFVTDVTFQLALPAASLLGLVDIQEMLKTLKDALEIWRHLKGAPPAKVEQKSGDGDHIEVTNNSGDVIIVNRPSVTLVLNDDTGARAVEQFIARPLSKAGIDALMINVGAKPIVSIRSSEAAFFTSVAATVPIYSNELDYALTIETIAFKDGNKWRFSDGGSVFYAEIIDEAFLAKIDQGEPFAKGDALRVRMRIEQSRQGSDLTTVRTIVTVHEHLRKQNTAGLF
jgi:hypothetical protein